MRKVLTPVALLVLAVVHTPLTAQARLFDFLPTELFGLSSSEPFVLLLTGAALLSLARLSPPRRAETPARHGAPPGPSAAPRVLDAAPPTERAA
jgi:hypothetical protein